MKIQLKNIVKNIVLQYGFANPFSDEFNKIEFIKSIEDEITKNKYNVEDIENIESIKVILELNSIYEFLMTQIEDLIDKINLDKIELINNIFALYNVDYFSLKEEMKDAILGDTTFIHSLEDRIDPKLKNIFGDKVDAQNAVDVFVDVCNLLLDIVVSFNPKNNITIPKLEKIEQIGLIRLLLLTANIYVNIENAFNYYKFEWGELKKKDDAIIFKHIPPIYYFQQEIGKLRYSNLLYEMSFSINNSFSEKRIIPELKIIDNSVTIINHKEREWDLNDMENISLLIMFFSHLEKIPLKYCHNITVVELLDILSALQSSFHHFNNKEIIDQAVESQNTKFTPIKIKKSILIKYLIKATKQSKAIVQKVLNVLTSTLNDIQSLWQTPLMQVGEYYYFIMPSIANAHIAYWLDKIIAKALTIERLEKAFRISVQNILTQTLKNGYKFDLVAQQELIKISTTLKDTLVFQTKSNLIILEVCLYNFPLQSQEYQLALEKVAIASNKLNERKELLRNHFMENNNVNIHGIVVTNYTFLSGLFINSNHILDLQLLKNYFFVGELRQGQVIFNHNDIQQKEMASFRYYHTEEEFNANLEIFLFEPFPIFDKLRNYTSKEYLIVPQEMHPKIYQDGIDTIPLNSRIWEQLNKVEYYLNQLYYFQEDYKEDTDRKYIEKKIHYYLPQVFNLIALEKDRTVRVDVINRLEAGNLQSISHLIFILHNAVANLHGTKVKRDTTKEAREFDYDKSQKVLESILVSMGEKNTFLSNIELNHGLDENEVDNIIEYLIDLLGTISQKNYTEDELQTYLMLLNIFITLAKSKDTYKKQLYFIVSNFVDTLNFNHYHQKARDFAENVLVFSLREEHIPILGWFCFFRCYTKQHNAFEALFYGNLFLSALTTLPEIDEFLLYNALYDSLLFFRNFGFYDTAKSIYKTLEQMPLNEYDKQKITLSYFNSQLLSTENLDELIVEADGYIKNNLDKIKKYKEYGAFPWVAFLMNLQNIHQKHRDIDNISSFENYLSSLKLEIDPTTLSNLEAKNFPKETESKKLLRDILTKVFETRNFNDLASELSELSLLAKNVIEVSISPLDIESLLLAGLVINDHSLTFQSKESKEFAPFISEDSNLKDYIGNYSQNIIKKLNIKENQIIIWLFEANNKVYALSINHNKEYNLKELVEWDFSKMRKWLANIKNFVFENKKGGFSINEQEQEYIQTLQNTSFANIYNIPPNTEVLICGSLTLSEFPHNLLQAAFLQKDISDMKHEELVKIYLNTHSDFISFNTSISNIISMDWFAQNGEEIEFKTSDFIIEAWIPLDDKSLEELDAEQIGIDIPIHTGYTKLQPIIENDYKGIIHTDVIPKKEMSATINLILAHGGKGIDGFTTIYTKNNGGKAILKKHGIEKILGRGEIAVLFICNSGSITKGIYTNTLNSFINTVLSRGYKAVIASAWKLNPDIASVWLETFLKELKNGNSLAVSVHKANYCVAKEGYDDYNGYYTPTGWAAMHLYGNPNIFFEI